MSIPCRFLFFSVAFWVDGYLAGSTHGPQHVPQQGLSRGEVVEALDYVRHEISTFLPESFI